MSKSILGKIVNLKNGENHYPGHHGIVISENSEDNEYIVAGGSISILEEDGSITGPAPSFCRGDFTVPRVQAPNDDYQRWLALQDEITR